MGAVDTLRGILTQRKRAYLQSFSGVAGKAVLADLAIFCRANETCFHPDARASAALEGRREVWLRIREHLDLTEEELIELHTPMKRK